MELALVTALAVIVLRYRVRPGNVPGAGRVTVHVLEKRSEKSVAAIVYVPAPTAAGVD